MNRYGPSPAVSFLAGRIADQIALRDVSANVTNAIQRKGISLANLPLIHIVTMNTMAELPTVFTTQWCGYCVRLKSQLSRAGIDFREIDIEDHADGAAVVALVNDGNLTVPTVLFGDGSALTNPSVAQVGSRLT
jgi:mycoredoxin